MLNYGDGGREGGGALEKFNYREGEGGQKVNLQRGMAQKVVALIKK